MSGCTKHHLEFSSILFDIRREDLAAVPRSAPCSRAPCGRPATAARGRGILENYNGLVEQPNDIIVIIFVIIIVIVIITISITCLCYYIMTALGISVAAVSYYWLLFVRYDLVLMEIGVQGSEEDSLFDIHEVRIWKSE